MDHQEGKLHFDKLKLSQIPVEDVLDALNVERIGNTKKYRCFNTSAHKAMDKSASMAVHPKENYCNCFGCNSGGGPVAIVMQKNGDDYYEASKWLHEAFNIPYLDGNSPQVSQKQPSNYEREIKYLRFDKNKAYNNIDLAQWIPKYYSMNDEQRLKLIYTHIYRFSLLTDQKRKIDYHKGRGIDSDHPMLEKIGFLSPADIKFIAKDLERLFPKEDLIRFNLFSSMDQEFYPGSWKYWSKTGFCVAPSMDLYSDMCNGFMLRNTDPNLKKGKLKEVQVSRSDISYNLPFGLTRELLLSDNSIEIYGSEGYVDGLSLGKEKLFIAATGVHGLKDEMFGLLEDKHFLLAYDMDNAGIRATKGYSSVTAKRLGETTKSKISTKYFLNTDKGNSDKARYISRIKKFTKVSQSERQYQGLMEKMPKAGVKTSVVAWEPALSVDKIVTDINEILKEYRKVYQSDLTGKTVQDAVKELRDHHKSLGVSARASPG